VERRQAPQQVQQRVLPDVRLIGVAQAEMVTPVAVADVGAQQQVVQPDEPAPAGLVAVAQAIDQRRAGHEVGVAAHECKCTRSASGTPAETHSPGGAASQQAPFLTCWYAAAAGILRARRKKKRAGGVSPRLAGSAATRRE